MRRDRPCFGARRKPRGRRVAGTARGLALLCGLATLACVRPLQGQRVTLGPRLGLSVSTMRFEDPNANEQTTMRPGYQVGLTAALRLRESLETEASVLLVQGGFGGRGGHPSSLRTMGIEVPLVFRVRAPWRVSPHAMGGMAVRYQVGCRVTDVGIVGQTGCADPVVGTSWRKLGLAWVAGVGAGLDLGRGTMELESAIHWGSTDVKMNDLPPGHARTADIRVSTAYRFPVR